MKKYYFVLVSIILLAALLATGCSGPALAKSGDTIKVHFTCRLADGSVFNTSMDGEPVEFTIGQGNVIPGLEQAVIGMKVGESKTVTIPADQAYGQHSDDLIIEVGRDELSPDIVPEVGMLLQSSQDGSVSIATILEVTETTIKIDANHPLAGQDLTFDIELIEIGSSQPQESNLTSIPLEEALTNGKPTIAEFGSSTCAPCKQMRSILEELAAEYEGKLNVIIVEVYEQMELAQQYEIMIMPTQIFFDSSGKEVKRHIGVYAKDDIILQLKEMGIE